MTSSPDLQQVLEGYSTLVVPGGHLSTILPMANDTSNPVVEVIRAFASLPPKDTRGKDRIILTVCTGSLLLPATGILRRHKGGPVQVTTHWHAIDDLKSLANDPRFTEKGGLAEVLEKIFVDAGPGKLHGTGEGGEGVRLITAGGVASGMDATLYLVEKRAGRDTAEETAKTIEYKWRRDEGVVRDD